MLEKTTRINFLYDFYQSLLTPKQRSYMEMYFIEDFSLGEISETKQVSRQAIYDNIRRTEEMLEEYEDKLMLYQNFLERQKLIQDLEIELQEQPNPSIRTIVERLKELE
ncbi:DNA-binding protein [Gracilibacillus halophilus YIM-C55.5]|uniref:UPF0122 protein J416_00944 n=1 Tax=Gracilibacillus halophilus YIM-C55.5 TaxID=1308866 RepID=N4WD97_9BACI|nr:putative DNA-binding protein [Gracilibacillus halophilus]ENH98268.1 DNA-binding protein [Gracilibacillus halophilus YIM-C55.5]